MLRCSGVDGRMLRRLMIPVLAMTLGTCASTWAQVRICATGPPSTGANPTVNENNGLGLTLDTTRRWADRRVLRIRFLNGDQYLRDQVWRFARQWESYADMDLVLSTSQDAEIRVAFKWKGDKSSWSKVGTDALSVAKDQPTMNFGWFDDNTSSDEFMRTTLHEFGHALGFKHEHQNPNAGIPWNKPAVYKHFLDTNGWDKARVDHNIFAQLSKSQVNATKFDPDSIMLYEIPNSLTIGNFSTKSNKSLSELDKRHAASIYPWRPKAIVTLRNPTNQTVKFQYKWSRDSEWRDASISANGRLVYWRSPKDGQFPSYEVRIGGRTTTHASNRLNPSSWSGRNYPTHEDGRRYRFESSGGTLKLVSD